MPSPFPGMDPYIEATGSWKGFHNLLIGECVGHLNAALPRSYVARSDERIQPYDDDGVTRNRQVEPDVYVAPRRRPAPGEPGRSGGVATLEPRVVPQAKSIPWYEMPAETFLEVLHFPDERVVTTLEVLSPTNKLAAGREEYLGKRRDVLLAGMNLLELDLLLGGRRVPLDDPLPPGDYYALLTRQARRDACEVFSWSARDALPTLPVPLRPEDGDVMLDLAAVFEATYDRGAFDRGLSRRYTADPPPLLGEADQQWAAGLVAAALTGKG